MKKCERTFNSTKMNYKKQSSAKSKSYKGCQLSLRKKSRIFLNKYKQARNQKRLRKDLKK